MKHDRLQGQLRIPEHILSLGGAMMSRGTVAWLLLGVLGCATKIVECPTLCLACSVKLAFEQRQAADWFKAIIGREHKLSAPG